MEMLCLVETLCRIFAIPFDSCARIQLHLHCHSGAHTWNWRQVALFSFADAALIRPLPYREPSRLVVIFAAFRWARSFTLVSDY